MQIESIKYNEKKSIFDVKINDENYMISYEVYDSLNIQSGINISPELYKEILAENNYQVAKKISYNFITYKARTEYETRLKIRSKIYDKNIEDKIIEHYKKLNLLDDKRFAKEYIDYLLNIKYSSISYLKFKLNLKGIKSHIYNPIIESIDKEIEYRNIKYLYEKKYGNTRFTDYKDIQKIFRYFTSKGFKIDDIKIVLGELNE